MNSPNPETIKELKSHLEQLQAIQESRRTQEEIICELSALICNFQKDFFLPYLTEIFHPDSEDIEFLKKFNSPKRQIVYLIDLFLSVQTHGSKINISENEWNKIASLLNEIVLTYQDDITSYCKSDAHFAKISVALPTFLNYFCNISFSYNEQTLERLQKNCGKFDQEVKKLLGFSVTEAITFSNYIKNLIIEKLNLRTELPSEVIKRRFVNSTDSMISHLIRQIIGFEHKPVFAFVQDIDDIYGVSLPNDITKKIIDFLIYDEEKRKGEIVYYANSNPFFDTPLIRLNEKEFLFPNYNFLIDSFYNRINKMLSETKKERYTQFKNSMLEDKVSEIFTKLFGKDVKIFRSYYVNKEKSEQDLLIYFKGFLFIVEVKDVLFRAPMRDPIRAFDKIESDFKKSITKGYEQCLRVEQTIEEGKDFEIFDVKTNKSKFQIKQKKIRSYFSIVVTQYRYGHIQTNLKNLLSIHKEALYPWSVCVDDLEAFVLALKKLKKGLASEQFINYLTYREAYHEHLSCGDELELCGYFINSPKDFKKYSKIEETFSTDIEMSNLFNEEYYNGLGFKNEIDIDNKRHRKTNEYQKKYEFDIISYKDIYEE